MTRTMNIAERIAAVAPNKGAIADEKDDRRRSFAESEIGRATERVAEICRRLEAMYVSVKRLGDSLFGVIPPGPTTAAEPEHHDPKHGQCMMLDLHDSLSELECRLMALNDQVSRL